MTEAEAKTKWCPFARLLAEMVTKGTADTQEATASYNRRISKGDYGSAWIPAASACIGSGCMSWREQWTDATEAQMPRVIGGFCGLAGRP